MSKLFAGSLGKTTEIIQNLDGEGKGQFLELSSDASLSGDFDIYQHNFSVLSGNFIQSNSPNTINYSYKNAFLQAEEAFDGNKVSYGPAYTGSKGFCILKVNPHNKTLTLSGDLTSLDTTKTYSIALGSSADSCCSKITARSGNVVTLDVLPAEYNSLSSKTEAEMIDLFVNDDNAFYVPGCPEVGNQVIKNFYGNHAEGGSVAAIGKYSHAEGRKTIADVRYSHAEGSHTIAGGMASHAEGFYTQALGEKSHAAGLSAIAKDDNSYVWSATALTYSKGKGTFTINPTDGKSGFYIGNESFMECLTKYGAKEALKNKTFDLGTGQGTMDALSAIITALGGKVTIPSLG